MPRLALPSLPLTLLLFCSTSLLLQAFSMISATPAQPLTGTDYNCSRSYTLRVDGSRLSPARPADGSDSCATSAITTNCVQSSEDDFQSCSCLSRILARFNDVINSEDCLLLSMEEGEYDISSTDPVDVNYTVVMVAASGGGAKVICQATQEEEEEESVNCTKSAPLVFNKRVGGERDRVEVVFEGLTFEGCTRPLQFDNLDRVAISNCSFSYFTASALDLFNIGSLEIHQSSFTHCMTNIKKTTYRGNSGAVSIAYYTPPDSNTTSAITHKPVVSITECFFKNNSAFLPQQNSRQQINLALNNNVYFGRGGGLGIFVQELIRNVTTFIQNCTFVENFASSFGGGAYLYISGSRSHHNFSVTDCNFTGNSAAEGSFGGGIQVAMLIRNFQSPPCNLEFVRCLFDRNVADYGGGLSTVQVYSQGAGNLVAVRDSNFTRNRANEVGSGLMFGSFLYVQNRNESYIYTTSNCMFSDNEAPGGTFGAGFINVVFYNDIVFLNNTGPALRVVGSQVQVKGHMTFVGNNAESHDGGALHIQAYGQIKVYPGSEIEFINNTGRIGAAIVVDVQRSSLVQSELIYNPNCFLIHSNSTLPPSEWSDVSISFIGNRANVGPAIFISHLNHCSWFSVQEVSNSTNEIKAFFSIHNFTKWQIFSYSMGDNFALTHTHDRSESFYFQTQPVKVQSSNKSSTPLVMWPGEEGRLNLEGIDQFGNPTYLIVRLSDNRSGINLGAFSQAGNSAVLNTSDTKLNIVDFDPALLPIQPSDETVNVSYGIRSFDVDSYDADLLVSVVLDTPYNVRDAVVFNLEMQLSNCLYGYELRRGDVGNDLVVCQCVNNDFLVLNCEQEVIILRDGYWAGRENKPLPHLDLLPCPIPYCRCHDRDSACENLFFQEDPERDLQCHPTRKGTLCGTCVNGTSVGVLRTNCRSCEKDNYYALGFLVVGDIILVGVVLFAAMKLKLVFPHSLKGLLFYVQTAYYTTEYFPISFWDIRKYMLYLSSASGFYFPWDFCLYPGMTALVSFSPRFTPAVIATTMATIAVIGAYYKRARDGRKYVWHGVWSLILLLYAPLVFTCASLLHCPETPSVSGEEEAYHWFLQGDIVCFRDPGHIVLGLVSCLVLTLLILLVPVIFVFTIVGKSQELRKMTRTIGWMYEALTAGYRDSYETRWWVSWELLRRLLLISLVVALPGRSVFPVLFICTALAFHIFARPYEKMRHNILEAIILTIYVMLFLLRGSQTFLDNVTTNYTGTQVPAAREERLAALDGVTWLFFPFFYGPLLVGALFGAATAIFHFARWIVRKKNIARLNQRESRAYSTGAYYYEYDSSRTASQRRRSSNHSADVTFTEIGMDNLDQSFHDQSKSVYLSISSDIIM